MTNSLICKHIICNSLKGVDQMVDQLSANYLYRRNNVFYFTKRVPKDLSNFYVTNRIVISLKTKSNVSAMRASKSLIQKLEDYWTSLRITKFEVPVQHLLSKDLIPTFLSTLNMELRDASNHSHVYVFPPFFFKSIGTEFR